jgi:hypothetical protein
MTSSDYKERFKAEYTQLAYRYKKLDDMVYDWDCGRLKFEPTCPRGIFDYQLKAMKKYLDVMEIRAEIEKIDLCDIQVSIEGDLT